MTCKHSPDKALWRPRYVSASRTALNLPGRIRYALPEQSAFLLAREAMGFGALFHGGDRLWAEFFDSGTSDRHDVGTTHYAYQHFSAVWKVLLFAQ